MHDADESLSKVYHSSYCFGPNNAVLKIPGQCKKVIFFEYITESIYEGDRWNMSSPNVLKIDSNISPKKVIQFRENRVQIPEHFPGYIEIVTPGGEKIRGKILDISRFGARISVENLDCTIRTGDQSLFAEFFLKNNQIYSGNVSIVNESKIETSSVTFGICFDQEGIDPDQVRAILDIEGVSTSIASSKKLIELSSLVRPEFKILVADLNTLFQDLKLKLGEEENKINHSGASENHKKRLEEQVIKLALSLYTEDIHRLFEKFKAITEKLDFDSTIIHKRYFRCNFHPLVIGTPFVNRGFTKPLGHAGDYGLMVMLYDYADMGGNLFEKFFHRFCCNEPAAVANKNRVEYLGNLISEAYLEKGKSLDDFKVTSIACGPAREIEIFLSDVNSNRTAPITVVCVDQEEQALAHAQSQLKPFSKTSNRTKIMFYQEDAILSLIKGKELCNQIADSQLIISAGLFDYLSDRVASRLVETMYKLLAPGGTLLVGNVSTTNPDRFSMDYFAEWNLILRNSRDMMNLLPLHIRDNPQVKCQVIAESLGINLFLHVTKPSLD